MKSQAEVIKRSFFYNLTTVAILAAIATGLFLVFAQFNSSAAQEQLLTHSVSTSYDYYEWDDEGQRHDLEPVYDPGGWLVDFVKPADPANRFGFAAKLETWIEQPILDIHIASNVIIFLDNDLIYTDFAGQDADLARLPPGGDGIQELFGMDYRQITVSLPDNYVGKTLTVVIYPSSQGYVLYVPIIENFETDQIEFFAYYGLRLVFSGLLIALLVALAFIFVWQSRGGTRPWRLLLIISIALVRACTLSNFVSFLATNPAKLALSAISAISRYCSGDLLAVFVAYKMKRRLRIPVQTLALIHLALVLAWFSYCLARGFYLEIDSVAMGAIGFVAVTFALFAMIREGRDNRAFRFVALGLALFCVGFGVMLLLYRVYDYSMYIEYFGILDSLIFLNFYPIIELLSVFMLIAAGIMAVDEGVSLAVAYGSRLAVLEEMNRSKTEFISNISHEIRAPLTVVSINVQTAAEALSEMGEGMPAPDQEVEDLLKAAQDGITNLARMVSGMLKLASMSESAKKSEVDLSALTREAAEMLRISLAKRANSLETEIEPGLSVLGDADMLAQVLTNLLQNAGAHTQDGTVTLSARHSASNAIVSVSDTGTGISPELLPHVFERGVTTGGTGVGLNLCRSIVESHGGQIWIESVPGEGTTASFSLPVAKEMAFERQ